MQVIDIAFEDIKQHIQTYYQPGIGGDGDDGDDGDGGDGRGNGGDEGEGGDRGDEGDDGDRGDDGDDDIHNDGWYRLRGDDTNPVEFENEDYDDDGLQGDNVPIARRAYDLNQVSLVARLIRVILNPANPRSNNANWNALVDFARDALQRVATDAVQNFTEDVFKGWLNSIVDNFNAILNIVLLNPSGGVIASHRYFNQFLEEYRPVVSQINTFLQRTVGRKIFKVRGDNHCLLHAYIFSHVMSPENRQSIQPDFDGFAASDEELRILRANLVAEMELLNMRAESIILVRDGQYLEEEAIQALAVLAQRDIYLYTYTEDQISSTDPIQSVGLRGFSIGMGPNNNVDESQIKFWYVRDLPKQNSAYDCGVFTCIYANYITRGHACVDDTSEVHENNATTVKLRDGDPLHNLHADYMPFIRKRIHYEILTGKLTDEL
ncbi:hypothetical protein CYMTET_40909 [Cymbomonas tetramitiformis]|uniref:Ubiquitin-like protease family profile domain-containing protein n=1 Tax=Cymbomonas tetramitiformis TaxID=36881 RepID=A0AAE0C857_9CHLO|nr:hypothetical protein CYMTET_40909 [Cymbomonas tetramitiformis]